jgi:hypothetical protein
MQKGGGVRRVADISTKTTTQEFACLSAYNTMLYRPTRRLLTKSPCYNGARLSPSLLALLYNEIHLTFRRLRQ